MVVVRFMVIRLVLKTSRATLPRVGTFATAEQAS